MVIFFIVLTAVVVFAIAAAAVGVVSQRLAVEHQPTVFSVEEAVRVVGDGLDDETSARISYEDVRRVVRWYVEFLDANELTDEDAYDAGEDLIVIDDADVLDHLQRRATNDPDLTAADVAVVHAGLVAYVEQIGALGAQVIGSVPPEGS